MMAGKRPPAITFIQGCNFRVIVPERMWWNWYNFHNANRVGEGR